MRSLRRFGEQRNLRRTTMYAEQTATSIAVGRHHHRHPARLGINV